MTEPLVLPCKDKSNMQPPPSFGRRLATHGPSGRYVVVNRDDQALLMLDDKFQRSLDPRPTQTTMAEFLENGKLIAYHVSVSASSGTSLYSSL